MSAPLSKKLDWDLANPLWAQTLNPLLASPLNGFSLLENIKLAAGANTINHGLGRMMQGWMICDINGVATLYRSQPFNANNLVLTSSASVTVNIGVF